MSKRRLEPFFYKSLPALLTLNACFCLAGANSEALAQSILPPRPEAIGGGNPLEGLGRADDPNPSRAGDFAALNTLFPTPTPDANAPSNSLSFPANTQGDPLTPSSNPILNPDANAAFNPGSAPDSTATAYPGTTSVQQLINSSSPQNNPLNNAVRNATGDLNDSPPVDPNLAGGPPLNAAIGNTPGAEEALKKAQELAKEEGRGEATEEPRSMFSNDKNDNSNAQREANFFKVVPDSPIRTTLVDIREGRYEAALNHLSSMYARNPAAIEMQYLMGVSAVMLHRNAEAEMHYQKVLSDKLAPLRLKQLAQKGLGKLSKMPR